MAKREWKPIEGFDFKEILFEEYNHIAKITIWKSHTNLTHPVKVF